MTAEEARFMTLNSGDFEVGNSTFTRQIALQNGKIEEAAKRGKRTCFLDISGTIWWEEHAKNFLDHYKSKGFRLNYKYVEGYGSGYWLEW